MERLRDQLSHSALKLPLATTRSTTSLWKAVSTSVPTIDEYAMYEARYLDVDSKGRKALEDCIVDVYKAIITYAAEMNHYIQHRIGVSLGQIALKETELMGADRVSKAVKGSSESSFVEFKAVIDERLAHSFPIFETRFLSLV